jgi:adenosylmethionine-8-amino-7-oxononanoate aminotransferase
MMPPFISEPQHLDQLIQAVEAALQSPECFLSDAD